MKIFTTFNAEGWDQVRASMARLGDQGPSIFAAMLNEGGEALREKTVAAEAAQTNLSHDVNDRAQVPTEAAPGRLSFVTTVHGGNVRLKYFGAKEGGGGVTASPWGKSTFYPGAFINSGFGGKRAPSPKLGGQVYARSGKSNLPIRQARSGLFLPDELMKGATVAAFDSGAPLVLDGILTKLAAMI